MSAVINEFAKMHRLGVILLAGVLFSVVVAVGLASSIFSPDFDRATESSWNALFGGTASGMTLAAPLLLALIASRHIDIEHQTNGWMFSATSGTMPGSLCRAKFLTLGSIVASVTLVASGVIFGTALLLGITAPLTAGRWLGFTSAILIVNLAILIVHIILSARIENQLVGVGIGLLGTILALFGTAVPSWMRHLTPWGYYALSTASGYRDGVLVAMTPAYRSVGALGVVVAIVFLVFTRQFDRKEV